MKKPIFVLLFFFLGSSVFAQLPDFDSIILEKKEDYTANADDAALQAARYLLTHPIEKDNLDRLKCMAYVIKWMSGTPHYTFSLDEQATRFAKKNDDLLVLYMAAMARFALENKADAKDEEKVKLNAVQSIVEYARNKDNKVKLNSELKKAIEAYDKGELADYLKKK